MSGPPTAVLTTPHVDELGLEQIANRERSVDQPAAERRDLLARAREGGRRILINQVFASPIAGGMGRLLVRIGGAEPAILACVGAEAHCRIGAADDRFVWEGEQRGVLCHASPLARPDSNVWLWRLAVVNRRETSCPATPCSFRISASANRAS